MPVQTALFLFHLRVGVRLALRYLAAFVAPFVIWIGIAEFPYAALLNLGQSIFGGSRFVWLPILAIGVSIASWASLRITRGTRTWMRHLPVSQKTGQWSVMAALIAAQSPFLMALLALALITPEARLLQAAICVCAVGLASAWIALPSGRERKASTKRLHGSVAPFEITIWWKAIGFRALPSMLGSLIPAGAAALFVSNNPLPPRYVIAAVEAGMLVGCGFLFSGLAALLRVRRPAWPFSRSLPQSCASRIFFDSAMFLAHATPALLICGWLSPEAGLKAGVVLPALSLLAAGAVRNEKGQPQSASGEILLAAFLAAGFLFVLPSTWIPCALLTPLAFRFAKSREAGQKVSRWHEFQHLAAGDPMSWSRN